MDAFNNLDDICLTFNSLRSNFYIAYVRMLSHYYIVERKVHADVYINTSMINTTVLLIAISMKWLAAT